MKKNKSEENNEYDDFSSYEIPEDLNKNEDDDSDFYNGYDEDYDDEKEEDEEELISRLKSEGKTYNKNYNYKDIPIKMENFDLLAAKFNNAILAAIYRTEKMYGKHSSLDKDDLYQEGLIALYKSIQKFNPERGVYFGFYLKIAINNEMKNHCRTYLPHKYVKKDENDEHNKKNAFKRMTIDVDSLDDGNSAYSM